MVTQLVYGAYGGPDGRDFIAWGYDPRLKKFNYPSERPEPPAVENPLVNRWASMAEALSDPWMELTAEEFAPVLVVFRQLQNAGVRFDPMLVALFGLLERQAFMCDGEGDNDNHDDDDRDGSSEGVY